MRHLEQLLTARWTAAVFALVALTSSVVFILGRGEADPAQPSTGLPASSEAAQVAEVQAQLPGGRLNPAVIVYSRGGEPLTGQDLAGIQADATALAPLSVAGTPAPAPSPDGRAALLVVPVGAEVSDEELIDVVEGIRSEVADGAPAGLVAEVTGEAGFTADLLRQFDGADVTLLATTAGVVALLLLVTYRSPLLWLVPLVVVGVGDQVAASTLVVIDRTTDLSIDAATSGIVSVLVFGAGTNYALLLIARYREELRREPDHRLAMRRALRGAAPAIAASAGTVFTSLLVLLLAVTPGSRILGLASAVGIAVALLFALTVLPAALVSVGGRQLFWPFVPRVGSVDPSRTGPWSRVAAAVARRPRTVSVAAVLVLAGLATGLTGVQLGLSPTEQFRTQVEADDGLQTISRYFPAGSGDPAVVVTRADTADEVAASLQQVPGVSRITPGEPAGDRVLLDAVLSAPPGSDEAFSTVRGLRAAVDSSVDPQALVGGADALDLDRRTAAARDLRVVAPLVLGVVLVILAVLLRAVVAPVLLVLTVIASYFASLGASYLLFTRVLGFPALDVDVPLISFLFLVALGVDYNIFLVTRAREEAALSGTRDGIRTALAVTGAVITSAGVLLAAVFAVLGVLPLITLTQLGIIVGLGVLLDTFLVRSVLVPALVLVAGERFWWPSRPGRPAAAGETSPHGNRLHGAPVSP